MDLPTPLPPRLVDFVAERFRVLSEPMRIRILDLLRGGERTVGDLVHELGSSQQNISKHLTTLHREGILARRKEGTRVIYWISDESVLELCEHVCGSFERQVDELRAIVESG
jgi:DNA-binding transcriptional ArsR family regulator